MSLNRDILGIIEQYCRDESCTLLRDQCPYDKSTDQGSIWLIWTVRGVTTHLRFDRMMYSQGKVPHATEIRILLHYLRAGNRKYSESIEKVCQEITELFDDAAPKLVDILRQKHSARFDRFGIAFIFTDGELRVSFSTEPYDRKESSCRTSIPPFVWPDLIKVINEVYQLDR